MAKRKYDWISLKAEFLASEFDEVASFLKEKIGRDNGEGYVAKMTRGWTAEKRVMKQQSLLEAKESLSEQLTERYTASEEKLSELNGELLELIDASLNFIRKEYGLTREWGRPMLKKFPNLSDLMKVFKIIRAEKEWLSVIGGDVSELVILEEDLIP